MTKTESAEHLIKTLVIESCEQLLDFHGAEGVRAAIPNTNNLIMVGPADWIAKNVPGVGSMVEAESKNSSRSAMSVCAKMPCGACVSNVYEAYEAGHLAATTQASTAQAESSGAEMHDVVVDLRKYASDPGYSHNDYADTMRQAAHCIESLRAMFWHYSVTPDVATSSTDAQAAAEVRDAWISVDERLPAMWKEVMVWPYPTDYCMTAELVGESASGNPVWKYGEYTNGWGHETLEITRPVTHWMPLPAAPSALRAGDTGEQADGGANA